MGWRSDHLTLRLADPTTLTDADWPSGVEALRAYATSSARLGSERLIANVRTRLLVLLDADVALPVTVNDADSDNSYVCSPYNAYIVYSRAEMHLLPSPWLRAGLGGLATVAGAVLKRARIDRTVVVNNWMLSTNLYPQRWVPDIEALTAALTRAFPTHYLCFRSLNRWTNAPLLEALVAGGYKLVASRQVYAYDYIRETWLPRSNVRHDRRLLRQSAYRIVEHDEIVESDYPRIAALYDELYRQKYPTHNPAFTEEYVRVCHRDRVMCFLGLRDPSGRLDGVVGLFGVDNVLTVPIVGYDTTLDRRLGLYRLLMLLPFMAAIDAGAVINLSAGAASFKRLRGGRPVVEYSAIFARHLPRSRQLAVSALARLVNGLGVPLMDRLQL